MVFVAVVAIRDDRSLSTASWGLQLPIVQLIRA